MAELAELVSGTEVPVTGAACKVPCSSGDPGCVADRGVPLRSEGEVGCGWGDTLAAIWITFCGGAAGGERISTNAGRACPAGNWFWLACTACPAFSGGRASELEGAVSEAAAVTLASEESSAFGTKLSLPAKLIFGNPGSSGASAAGLSRIVGASILFGTGDDKLGGALQEASLLSVGDEPTHEPGTASVGAGISGDGVNAGATPEIGAVTVGPFALPSVNAAAVVLLGVDARIVAGIAPPEPLPDSLAVPSELEL